MKAPPLDAQVAFLKRVPLLHGLDAKLLGTLAGIMQLRRVGQGEVLCKEGGPGDACFIIGHGQVDVVASEGESERHLCSLGPGHVVGEVALIDGKRRSATVRCKTDVSVFILRRDDFERLLGAGNPASMRLLDNIAQALALRVRTVNQRYADIFSRSGETIAKLTEDLERLKASCEGDAEASDLDEDEALLKLIGYQAAPTGG